MLTDTQSRKIWVNERKRKRERERERERERKKRVLLQNSLWKLRFYIYQIMLEGNKTFSRIECTLSIVIISHLLFDVFGIDLFKKHCNFKKYTWAVITLSKILSLVQDSNIYENDYIIIRLT